MKKNIIVFFACILVSIIFGDGETIRVTPGQIFVGTEVRFELAGIEPVDPSGPPPQYEWEFKDHSHRETGLSVTHSFKEPGTYQIECKLKHESPPRTITKSIQVNDRRVVEAEGSGFLQGVAVQFHARFFAVSRLKWDFNDGHVNNNGSTDESHVFNNPGNYTVKVYDFNGETTTAITCQVNVVADNRSLNVSPDSPMEGEKVTCQVVNFPSSNLRWDFGGTVKNGGASMEHQFSRPGNFDIKVKDLSNPSWGEIKKSVNVRPDNRVVEVRTPTPRARQTVAFETRNFGSSLKWDFGDGNQKNGGQSEKHIYQRQGQFKIKVEDLGNPQLPPKEINVRIQNDNRVIRVTPDHIFEGSLVTLESRFFLSQTLKWDFNDGTVQNAGTKHNHVFKRPGNFVVKVYDEGGQSPVAVEKRIRVERENRSIRANSQIVYSGAPVELEPRNFRSGVQWEFGDGTKKRGSGKIFHTYQRNGIFEISAVDFNGKGSKKITLKVNVQPDTRVLVVPDQIIAGEAVNLDLKNVSGGSFQWQIAGGGGGAGPRLTSHIFYSPGNPVIKIIDRSGKYPPLEKRIRVLPDNRSLEISPRSGIPGDVFFMKSMKFRGPAVRWDFGDGTVKNMGKMNESHAYKKTGTYRVTAVDFSGKSKKIFSKNVVVSDLTPNFNISHIELTFANGKYYRVVSKKSGALKYQAKFRAGGRGVLKGQWILDGMNLSLFQMVLRDNQPAVMKGSRVPTLPLIDLGMHRVTFEFSNYSFPKKIPIIRYFVTETGAINLDYPESGAKLDTGPSVELKWSYDKPEAHYEIALSVIPFQFLQEQQMEWRDAGEKSSFALNTGDYKDGDWIYWQVREVDSSGKVLTTSEIGTFKIIK